MWHEVGLPTSLGNPYCSYWQVFFPHALCTKNESIVGNVNGLTFPPNDHMSQTKLFFEV